MKDYNITTDNDNAVADNLHRIHCYAQTLAQLCAIGGDITINQDKLEQIFADIATVTDQGAEALYRLSEIVSAQKIMVGVIEDADKPCAHTQFAHLAESVLDDNTDVITDAEAHVDQPPFIKTRKVVGNIERIYVPHFVPVAGRDMLDVLDDGIVIPSKYAHYKVDDFELWIWRKDSFRETYLLIPKLENRSVDEHAHDFYKRCGMKIVRDCKQV